MRFRRSCERERVGEHGKVEGSPVVFSLGVRVQGCAAVLFIAAVSQLGAAPPRARSAALSRAGALAMFKVDRGLHVELVAAEPLVVDPVAIAFDERGRLYVVENRGYPEPIDGKPAGNE